MTVDFMISEVFPVSPGKLFSAWLDSKLHSEMTGGKAEISDQEGNEFTAWDGYISGKNLKLERPISIIQSWRTTEFSVSDPDSVLEITFISEGDQTRLTIRHSELPEHGMQYHQGWVDAYFNPMKEFFQTQR